MGGRVLEHEGKTIFTEGQRKEKFDIARRLREMGMNDADIRKATNLSLDDLRIL